MRPSQCSSFGKKGGEGDPATLQTHKDRQLPPLHLKSWSLALWATYVLDKVLLTKQAVDDCWSKKTTYICMYVCT